MCLCVLVRVAACVSDSVCMYVQVHVQQCLIKACVVLSFSHTPVRWSLN